MERFPLDPIRETVLIKKKAQTSSKYGCPPEQRPTEILLHYGIVNIDKPRGPTSHQVSAYVQQIIGGDKSGHSGTLDPKVTGVLPVALGEATKVVQSLLLAGKEYVALMHIHKLIPQDKIETGVKQFVGKITQMPPQKSAVKRQWRQRTIYYLKILEIAEQDVLFIVGCQAGTYIRKLIHDIGIALGCGAHMAELRRTRVATFDESLLCTLHDLRDAYWFYRHEQHEKYIRSLILPVEKGVEHLHKIWVLDTTVDSLCHGAVLTIPGIAQLHLGIEKELPIAVMTLKQELVATGIAQLSSKEIMNQEKGIAVILNRVFMKPGTYPKMMRSKVEQK